jgi:hypothetical protein
LAFLSLEPKFASRAVNFFVNLKIENVSHPMNDFKSNPYSDKN